ncbi:MAG: sigma-54 dependent transcriptional regulator [Pseudomonadota bacterium]|nr:sigma-54 dependent transcriptional regulator [Pseudomonadota bacterium]
MAKVLMVDDDAGFTDATAQIIALLQHSVTVAGTVADARQCLEQHTFDLVLLDIMLPDGSGFEVLEALYRHNRSAHIAFITGHVAVKNIVRSVAGPEVSFLLKPIDVDKIRSLFSRVVASAEDNSALTQTHFGVLVGESANMQSLYTMIERVAASSANVLIQGQSGTGKELVARAIHNASGCDGAFVAANCGAIPTDLIASELFGHEKGAFTGANARKIGLFERAQGGTLFLDEVTEMPLDLQPNLLRALETGRITRVGGSEEIAVNCRVLSATNRTRDELASKQYLREDIYFRLAVFPIELPPLQNRKEDIPLLAQSFLDEFNREQGTGYRLDNDALARLECYRWPGNVRELRHAIQRAHILTPPDAEVLVLPDDLGSPFASETKQPTALQAGQTIEEVERQLILETLKATDGNKPEAAEMLGISLKTLYNRLNQYQQTADTNLESG